MIVTEARKRQSKNKYRFGGSSSRRTSEYRYGGNGILNNLLGRKGISNTVKNIINSVNKSGLIQKTAGAVQDGALKAVTSQTQKAIDHLANNKATKKQKKVINNLTHDLASNIPSVSSIANIIGGKGIVRD